MIRVGSGFDAHAFAENRKLVLGGVEIDYHLGLAGHSDADVLLHAICDAMLGATAQGDIGQHFPPSDQQYKDISSVELLKRVDAIVKQGGWSLVNADATLICEEPKLATYIERIRANIAAALDVERSQISIKATTSERLGFTGRKEGIAATAVVLMEK